MNCPQNYKHRILICGDREWNDTDLIKNHLLTIGPENIEVVIQGCCRGADVCGMLVARELRIKVLQFPPDWKKFGKAASPIRNSQMIKDGRPTQVIAFHDHIESSKGTYDMIKQAKEAGIPCRLISHKDKDDMWDEYFNAVR